MEAFTHKSTPNPARLIDSMRHLGYDNYHAIADLVDNSLDAEARNVKVAIRARQSDIEIIVADDGTGMDSTKMNQAIRLGSIAEKDPASDLGRFGMGLCTASLSICTQTIVLTKTVDGEILKAVNDVDEVKRQNEFVSYMGKPEADDMTLFEEMTGKAKSGTVVVLRKCDCLQNRNTTSFANGLKKELSRIFRYFLAAETSISVNDQKLSAYDPLEWDNPHT
ncbi:MAG: ATP-binding protein, partial [Phycisphaerae bacterium]